MDERVCGQRNETNTASINCTTKVGVEGMLHTYPVMQYINFYSTIWLGCISTSDCRNYRSNFCTKRGKHEQPRSHCLKVTSWGAFTVYPRISTLFLKIQACGTFGRTLVFNWVVSFSLKEVKRKQVCCGGEIGSHDWSISKIKWLGMKRAWKCVDQKIVFLAWKKKSRKNWGFVALRIFRYFCGRRHTDKPIFLVNL